MRPRTPRVPTSSLDLFPPLWLLQTHQSTRVAKWGQTQTAEVITNTATFPESLEPFPTYVPNSPSLKHWLSLGCAKLVSLTWGLMIWGSQWTSPTCSFNFLSQIFLLIFLPANRLSLSPGKLWLKPFDICQDCQMALKHVVFGGRVSAADYQKSEDGQNLLTTTSYALRSPFINSTQKWVAAMLS